MNTDPPALDLSQIRVLPLSQRRSLSRVEEILVDPDTVPLPGPESVLAAIRECARRIREARARAASVILVFGAHLLRNGAALILERLMARKWITHLATNGACMIHDWEYSFLGRSTESVRENVAAGTFGAWEETGLCLHLALLAGGVRGDGYGRALGRFIAEEGTTLPSVASLEDAVRAEPAHPLAAARCDLLRAMIEHGLAAGSCPVPHPWKQVSLAGQAYCHQVPLTVHPGIGYDIISNHPMFNGAVIGRAAALDYRRFAAAVEHLDQGVVMSIGSAIMGPQVFEKSLSFVNNLRLQQHRPIVQGHRIFVVDLQEGGNWDWTTGEPPKTNPAYYLRFCKSYARMGGAMQYVCCDNLAFIHHLYHQLAPP